MIPKIIVACAEVVKSKEPDTGSYMLTKKFQRKREDFVCKHCGAVVVGTGYTNHCPRCLWSRHVDVNPGDRQNPCGGMMEPKSLIYSHGDLQIVHKCTVCGLEKVNKVQENDCNEAIKELSTIPSTYKPAA